MTQDTDTLYRLLEIQVQNQFKEEGSGHDWWHIVRVVTMARRIAVEEGADEGVVALAALLHDIADHKFHGGDLEAGPRKATELLSANQASPALIQRIAQIIREVSYKGAGVPTPVSSLEAACVQDADRLDAIGALGIARAFAFGGSRNRLLFDPDDPPVMHEDFRSYSTSSGATINHFHEKLLLLRDRMNTPAGGRLAESRHAYMEGFLTRFHQEWEGEA